MLQEIIQKYKRNLEKVPAVAERVWQKFFEEYILLFDTRYVRIEKGTISTIIEKQPDLMVTDVYGYLDIYELKKTDTKLLVEDKSHNTYYWSSDISKVIGQVSIYLQDAKDNRGDAERKIRNRAERNRKKKIEVSIIKPKGIIVAGTSQQLDTKEKQDQFKTLRESLKDIEFILYDELFDRMNNLLERIDEVTSK